MSQAFKRERNLTVFSFKHTFPDDFCWNVGLIETFGTQKKKNVETRETR